MIAHFGSDIIREFIPRPGEEFLPFPSQNPTIYIFEDKPTRTIAAAGTGAIATISSWTQLTAVPHAYQYVIPAIDDPDPTGVTAEVRYWEAVNYISQSGEQTQTVIRSFNIYRDEAGQDRPGTTVEDLKKVFPQISSYASDEQLDEVLLLAEDEIKRNLAKRGFLWSRLRNLHQIKIALAYRAIAFNAMNQIVAEKDRHDIRFHNYLELSSNALNSALLPYDEDGDGEEDTIVVAKPKGWLIER